MIDQIDILIVNALPVELDAAVAALALLGNLLERREIQGIPCCVGALPTNNGLLRLALARPTRMGAVPIATTASTLVTELRPNCLAMSGVCAGNPSDVALGDVIIAEAAYAYDEGKRTVNEFQPDHRQIPLSDRWTRLAQELLLEGLPTYGTPTDDDRRDWFLEQLAAGTDPAQHPAKARFLDGSLWETTVRALDAQGTIVRKGASFKLTRQGRDVVAKRRAYRMEPVARLPFAVHTGPIASGNVVVKDGVTWESLTTMGVRSAIGLEMEAAAIAQVAHRLEVPSWIVAKGVMDYADPKKDDRFKPFAAAASAQVLMRFLQTATMPHAIKAIAAGVSTKTPANRAISNSYNVVGDVSGSNINVNQIVAPPGC